MPLKIAVRRDQDILLGFRPGGRRGGPVQWVTYRVDPEQTRQVVRVGGHTVRVTVRGRQRGRLNVSVSAPMAVRVKRGG